MDVLLEPENTLEALGQPHSVALAVTQKVLGSAITLLSILGIHVGVSRRDCNSSDVTFWESVLIHELAGISRQTFLACWS